MIRAHSGEAAMKRCWLLLTLLGARMIHRCTSAFDHHHAREDG